MLLAAPLALLLLAPWAAAVVWTLRGRGEFAWVPFTRIWPRPSADAPPARRWRWPPFAILLLLASMLVAIAAAAGPMFSGAPAAITVVLDPGLSTAAALATDDSVDRVLAAAGDPAVTWIDAATSEVQPTSLAALRRALKTIRPTAADVAERLPQVVRTALRRDDRAVVVISVSHPQTDDARVRWLRPATPQNAGIERFAITPGPNPQAMVTLYNGTAERRATLAVDENVREIDLPPTGGLRDYFFDLPNPSKVATAELRLGDAIPADNVAYLGRENVWPRLASATPLPPALARMVDAYSRSRPPSEASQTIEITRDRNVTGRAALLAARSAPIDSRRLEITPHALTRDVDWPTLLADQRGDHDESGDESGDEPGDGWQPLLRAGDRVLLAVRATPPRQVFVGFDPSIGASTAGYVVFWTGVFDFLAGAPEHDAQYGTHAPQTSRPAGQIDLPADLPSMDAPPGVVSTKNGVFAISVPAVHVGTTANVAPLNLPRGTRPLRPMLLLLAAALLLAAQVASSQSRSRTTPKAVRPATMLAPGNQ